MKSSNEQKLGDAIKDMLKLNHLDDRIDEYKLIRSWEKAVGPQVARHTTDIFISNRKLVVTIDSAVVRNEVLFVHSRIVKDLNAIVGTGVIDELVLR